MCDSNSIGELNDKNQLTSTSAFFWEDCAENASIENENEWKEVVCSKVLINQDLKSGELVILKLYAFKDENHMNMKIIIQKDPDAIVKNTIDKSTQRDSNEEDKEMNIQHIDIDSREIVMSVLSNLLGLVIEKDSESIPILAKTTQRDSNEEDMKIVINADIEIDSREIVMSVLSNFLGIVIQKDQESIPISDESTQRDTNEEDKEMNIQHIDIDSREVVMSVLSNLISLIEILIF